MRLVNRRFCRYPPPAGSAQVKSRGFGKAYGPLNNPAAQPPKRAAPRAPASTTSGHRRLGKEASLSLAQPGQVRPPTGQDKLVGRPRLQFGRPQDATGPFGGFVQGCVPQGGGGGIGA